MNGNDLVTVKNVKILVETEKAYGCRIEDEDDPHRATVDFWLPISQVDRNTCDPKGNAGEIDIPRWLAEKNDLDYED